MSRFSRFGMLVLVAVLVLGIAVPAYAEECGCEDVCRSPGYWKNHPDEWPVDSIVVGGVTYTKEEAIELMNMQGGDKSITLFKAVVAAKLDMLIGCDYCCVVAGALGSADDWLASRPAGSGVLANSACWKCAEPWYWILDYWYNS